MTYTLIINPEAQQDIEQAYNYYSNQVSTQVAELFYDDLQESYSALQINPFYQIRIKHYRAIPLKKFPYLLFFEIIVDKNIVKILALFNTYQDTEKYPQ